MAHFAVIEDGLVINAIIADDLPTAIRLTGKHCIEYENQLNAIGIGWRYKDGLLLPPSSDTPIVNNEVVVIGSDAQSPSSQTLEALDNVTGGY
jgi:hypothetical protein